MPTFSVIIVNYNAGDRLRRCLDRLADQQWRDFETIVIDNASVDDSISLAKASRASFRLIDAGANLGFAAANNRAVTEASGEWLVFLNPDAYAEPDWLVEFAAAIERYPGVDAFGSTQINALDPSLIDGAGDVFHVLGVPYRGHFGWPIETLPPEGECFAPCGAAAMYRKSTFESLGGFDERFFCYGEDVDLGFRLRLQGGRAIQLQRARVLHEGSGVTGRHSDFTIYHGHRNRIWTTYKNMPGLLYWCFWPARRLIDLLLFIRFFKFGLSEPYRQALKDGYAGLKDLREDRRRLQKGRFARLSDIACALAWSPTAVSRRRAVIRPIGSARAKHARSSSAQQFPHV